MNLKESTLAAVEAMNNWADYLEVFSFMKDNGYFVGNSKTPKKSVASELYKHAAAGLIDKDRIGNKPIYKKKEC